MASRGVQEAFLKKSLAVLASMFLALLCCASAQDAVQTTTSTQSYSLPKAAAPSSTSSSDIRGGRLEIGINFGGTSGYSFGSNHVSCSSTAGTQSCDPTLNFGHNNGGSGILNTAFVPYLPEFFQTSRLTPGNGVTFGARVGWNINPTWQVELQYNHANVDIGWTKLSLARQAVADFCDGNKFSDCFDDGPTNRRLARFQPGGDGEKKGNQDQYLVNIIYHLNPDKRFVPYVGGGLGASHYYNLPRVDIFNAIDRNCPTDACTFDFKKFSASDTAFSLDGLVGVKYYVTSHWGVNAEFQNVISFTKFDQQFQSVDNDDACTNQASLCTGFTSVPTGAGSLQPPSGKTHQEGVWNHAQFNAGVFWKF
jgi:opacity protein-like surface antigen